MMAPAEASTATPHHLSNPNMAFEPHIIAGVAMATVTSANTFDTTNTTDTTDLLSPRTIRQMELENEVAEQAIATEGLVAQAKATEEAADHSIAAEGALNNDVDADSVANPPPADEQTFEVIKPRVLQICTATFPYWNLKRILIEDMKGGSYNHVIGLTLPAPSTPKFTFKWLRSLMQNFRGAEVLEKQLEKYIVRIPRYELLGYGMEYDIATLQLAQARLTSPVPRLISYDLSTTNALRKPYMIQEQLPGQNLDDVIPKLNVAQLKCLTRRLMEILIEMRGITSTSPGVVRPCNPVTQTNLNKFMVPSRNKIYAYNFSKPLTGPSGPQTTLQFILEQCTRFENYEIDTDGWAMPVWDDLRKIAHSLHGLGFIPDDDVFHLSHMDLMARNILIEIINDSTVEITGLLDWDADYACFCPKFVAFRAPFWLWLPQDANDTDETLAGQEPDDPDHRELKKLFEDLADPEWKLYAFKEEYVLARRMFRTLKNGLFSNMLFEDALDIIAKWHLLHPTQGLSQSMWAEHGSDNSYSNIDSDSDSGEDEDENEHMYEEVKPNGVEEVLPECGSDSNSSSESESDSDNDAEDEELKSGRKPPEDVRIDAS